MNTTQKLNLTKTQKLVDLNEDLKNFEVEFSVISENSEPFEAVVVDQTTLDNAVVYDFQKVTNGVITGSVSNDKNTYQNHFLILKAEKPCNVNVTINRKEIKANEPVPKKVQFEEHPLPSLEYANGASENSSKKGSFPWKTILVVIVIGIILYWIYTIFSDSKSQTSRTSHTPNRFVSGGDVPRRILDRSDFGFRSRPTTRFTKPVVQMSAPSETIRAPPKEPQNA